MTTGTRRTAGRRRSGTSLLVFAIVGIALLAIVAVLFAGGDDGEDLTGSPTLSGEPLPVFAAGAEDPAVGSPAPAVEGADFAGAPVSITDDGTAKIILFLAHWCPHCQREVPVVQEWIEQQGLPEGVERFSVATSIDPSRPNYPPDAWLEGEGWSPPVVVDDTEGSVAQAYGLEAFPYWVFVDASGTVVGRATGELPAQALEQIATELAPDAGAGG